MNREVARAIIDNELANLRKLSYAEIVALMGEHSTETLRGPDDKQYHVELQAFWDARSKNPNIRVRVCVDDGHLLSAVRPRCGEFIISPNDSFVGE